jgi:hypothetical protein
MVVMTRAKLRRLAPHAVVGRRKKERFVSDVPNEVTEWCRRFAVAAGVEPPTGNEIDDLLALAAIAAHASARQAAPITCWLAAKAGVSLDAALATAQAISDS